MRQISELEEEDFSLLETTVRAGGSRDAAAVIQVELSETQMSGSVAEQLDDLLERLRMEKRGRVSVDSGAVSDMESGSGAALDEEEASGNRGEMGSTTSSARGEMGSASFLSCGVENVESLDKGVGSVVNGPQVQLKHTAREHKTPENSDTEKLPSSSFSSSSFSSHRPYTKRKGWRESAQRETNETRTDYSRSFPGKGSGAHGRGSEQRIRTPRAEVIEHRRFGEPANFRSKPGGPPAPSGEQPGSESSREVDREVSPTEGGPFITHWGKGRWRKNGGVRDRGRRQYNPHQYTAHPAGGPKFGPPSGVNRTRYPPSRGRSIGYHARHERDSNSYCRQSGGGDSGGKNTGGEGTTGLQEKGGDSQQILGKSLGDGEREITPPQGRRERENSTEVQTTVGRDDNFSAEAAGKEVGPDTAASKSSGSSANTTTTDLPVKLGSQAEKSTKRLSYACVTSSSSGPPTVQGSGRALRSSPKPPPAAPCGANVDSHDDEGATLRASTNSSNCPVVTQVSTTSNGAVNSTTAIATATKTTTTATKVPTNSVIAANVITNDPASNPTTVNATNVEPPITTTERTTATKDATTERTTATKDATTDSTTAIKDNATATTARPKATTTAKDYARPTDTSTNRAIAASFNYSKAVEFLWKGELKLSVVNVCLQVCICMDDVAKSLCAGWLEVQRELSHELSGSRSQ